MAPSLSGNSDSLSSLNTWHEIRHAKPWELVGFTITLRWVPKRCRKKIIERAPRPQTSPMVLKMSWSQITAVFCSFSQSRRSDLIWEEERGKKGGRGREGGFCLRDQLGSLVIKGYVVDRTRPQAQCSTWAWQHDYMHVCLVTLGEDRCYQWRSERVSPSSYPARAIAWSARTLCRELNLTTLFSPL